MRVVVDGELASALTVTPGAGGRVGARVDTSCMTDVRTEHGVTAWSETHAASARRSFRVDRPCTLPADVPDCQNGDHGPQGRCT